MALGVSGGIVPCVDALVVLLIAVALNRLVFGLAILVAFSLGLAATLIAIGIMALKAKPMVESLSGGRTWVGGLPLVSSSLIFLKGLAITAQVLVAENSSPSISRNSSRGETELHDRVPGQPHALG